MLQLAPTHSLASRLRPVALRMRPDLMIRERKVGARTYFIIKDPIRLSHHQLWEEEFALLQMLDGKTSVSEMEDAFHVRFPGSRLDSRLLQVLHGQFYRNSLVLSDNTGQAGELQKRRDRLRLQLRWGRVRGWMAIRFRGFNPDSALAYLDQRMGWLFDAPALLGLACFLVFTLLFFVLQGASVLASIPSINEYFNAQSLLWVYLTFIALKVLHELGHGLACKHYGGECNEMGLMLLIFTPCLYCDVTDSWMVENKWKRAMIASAGIWFELIAAASCMWVWWFTNPGILHSLCFNAVLVGTIGTFVFNGNPLLKYDAYFVVSDLCDRPNLSQQASRVVRNTVAQFFMRDVPLAVADYSGRDTGFLFLYGILSGAYKWVLGVAVAFLVYKLFQMMLLESVGLLLLFAIVAGWLYWLANAVRNFVKASGRRGVLRTGRASLTLLATIALLAAVVWLPLPSRLHSIAFIEVKDVRSVVLLVSGRLLDCQPEGADVRAGDAIAKFASEELQMSLALRRGELSRQQARLIGLESRRSEDSLVASRIPTVQEAIDGLQTEVSRLESDIEQLTLRAPRDGRLFAPITTKPQSNPNEIETWSGSPMDAENLGCVLSRGTVFCEVGDPSNFQATVYLTQDGVELVRPGQKVILKSKSLPSKSFRGVIAEVGSGIHYELPMEIAESGVFPNRINRNGRRESIQPLFVARVEIQPEDIESLIPLHHSTGQVTIHVAPRSIGEQLARFFFSSFAIDPTVQRKASQ